MYKGQILFPDEESRLTPIGVSKKKKKKNPKVQLSTLSLSLFISLSLPSSTFIYLFICHLFMNFPDSLIVNTISHRFLTL